MEAEVAFELSPPFYTFLLNYIVTRCTFRTPQYHCIVNIGIFFFNVIINVLLNFVIHWIMAIMQIK